MSPQITIVNHLTPAIVLTIEANIAAAKLISDPIVIAMTDSQTKRLIKVGPSRTAQLTA
jgi:hypothetical protein